MNGGIIYAPKPGSLSGEYGKLGANLYNPGLASGCRAGCRYCNNPKMPVTFMRRDALAGHEFEPKPNVIDRLVHDCDGKYHGCKMPVVMGFVGDIFQPMPKEHDVTLKALHVMASRGLVPAVLTKFGTAACKSFDVLKAAGGWFGQTIAMSHNTAFDWEPNAADVADRMDAQLQAQDAGVRTWVSVEPVVDHQEALDVLHGMLILRKVDHFKLGKLNGYDAETRAIEKSINWTSYREEARKILNAAGYREITEPGVFEVGTYYLKSELREAQ